MSTTDTEAPDTLLRRLAAQALNRAERCQDTAERIGWLSRYSDLQNQMTDLSNAGDD